MPDNFLNELENMDMPVVQEEAPIPEGGPALYAAVDAINAIPPIAVADEWHGADAGGVAPGPLVGAKKKKLMKYAAPLANKNYAKYKYDYAEEDSCDGSDDGVVGLMVFYINVGNLALGQSLDMIDKVKDQYKAVEKDLANSGIRVMWLPVRTGETHGQYFNFRL